MLMKAFFTWAVACFLGASMVLTAAEAVDATDLDALRALAGQEATVEGVVTEVGRTREDTITFINIGAPKKQGFVAVVFAKDYPAFSDGFDRYSGKKVRVTGPVSLFRSEQPQIVLTSPEQIQVVEE